MEYQEGDTFLESFPNTKDGREAAQKALEEMAKKLKDQNAVKRYGVFLNRTEVNFGERFLILYLRDREMNPPNK